MTITLSRANRWKNRARFLLSGAAVLALTGLGLALPTQLTAPEPQFLDVPEVELGAGVTTLMCPGAPQLTTAMGSGDVSYDLELDTGADALTTRTVLTAAGALEDPALIGELGDETSRTEPQVELESGAAPLVARYQPAGREAPSVAGVTLGHAEEGDLRGLVAGGCVAPSANLWLPGGNTEVGSSTQLVLTNPGETAAQVRVQGWTGTGPMSGEVVELVEPGASKVVLTETMERGERVAFQVVSEGGQVSAYLTTSSLDGIVPAGVSYVTPAAAPGLEGFVGPLRLEEFDDEERQTSLRVVNPGQDPAEVSVSLLGQEGEEPLGGAEDLTIEPGTVTDVPVAAPEAGDYALRVVSTEPVAASAHTAVVGEESADIGGTPADGSWLPSGNLTAEAMFPTAGNPTIAIANPAPENVDVQVEGIGEDGEVLETEEIAVAASQTVGIEVPQEAIAVRITGGYLLATAQYEVDSPSGKLVAAVPATWAGRAGTNVSVVVTN